MSSEKTQNEEFVDSIDADNMTSVDDFIKELEEKERDLQISSDLVIEVGESSVEHDNIHDSFVSGFMFTKAEPETEVEEEEEEEPAAAENDEVQELLGQIENLMSERDDLVDSLRRHKIDFENYRNRTERDRDETFNRVLSGFAMQILPVLDNLERALSTAKDPAAFTGEDLDTFIEGLMLVNNQMAEVLDEMGVRPIRALGEPFDPMLHDAVDCVATASHPPGHVVEELMRGYRLGEQVIRPSMVRVSEELGPASQHDE